MTHCQRCARRTRRPKVAVTDSTWRIIQSRGREPVSYKGVDNKKMATDHEPVDSNAIFENTSAKLHLRTLRRKRLLFVNSYDGTEEPFSRALGATQGAICRNPRATFRGWQCLGLRTADPQTRSVFRMGCPPLEITSWSNVLFTGTLERAPAVSGGLVKLVISPIASTAEA